MDDIFAQMPKVITNGIAAGLGITGPQGCDDICVMLNNAHAIAAPDRGQITRAP